jgi:hypothetical protein
MAAIRALPPGGPPHAEMQRRRARGSGVTNPQTFDVRNAGWLRDCFQSADA